MQRTTIPSKNQIANRTTPGDITAKEDYTTNKGSNHVDVYYRTRTTRNGWLPEVKNLEDYAGWEGVITDIAIRVSKGSVKYRVHSNGKWYPYVTGYDINDDNNGYAGTFGKQISKFQMCIE